MKIGEFEQAIANDPSTSFWLKEQLEATKHRDPVDALDDAESLVSALKSRLNMPLVFKKPEISDELSAKNIDTE
ncbi:hypothetical protein K0504_09690 [Neiella marina]|uniref:Uncharacterized protein n=1 Tax=Neiella holothuriorum TaxID=2870530 RepID=A0ABS7EG82_9GAMM|nr:hypothetical protein [Neiella holothuriorum]MBW8191308.1 hypothetical protein [Neiella holothuriorum]